MKSGGGWRWEGMGREEDGERVRRRGTYVKAARAWSSCRCAAIFTLWPTSACSASLSAPRAFASAEMARAGASALTITRGGGYEAKRVERLHDPFRVH